VTIAGSFVARLAKTLVIGPVGQPIICIGGADVLSLRDPKRFHDRPVLALVIYADRPDSSLCGVVDRGDKKSKENFSTKTIFTVCEIARFGSYRVL